MGSYHSKRLLMVSVATAALIFGTGALRLHPFGMATAIAQESGHSGSGQGGMGGQGGRGGQGGQGGQSGQGGSSHGSGTVTKGTPGKGLSGHVFETDEGPSADAKGPQYGGGKSTLGKPGGAGTKKGDEFGDLWIILRDANGVPVLTADGFVQPIDKDGNLIPLDATGAPVDLSLVQDVELGRTNVGRSPTKTLDKSLSEVVKAINAGDSVSLDDSGRLVVTKDGVASTIDSPTENLALYKTLMTTGTLPGVTDPSKLGSLSFLVDGVKTVADMKAATGFLAGATDKEGALNVDEIVYLNQILGIPGTITGPDGKSYVDYSSFTYDRQSIYGSMTAQVLVQTAPDTYAVKTVNVYDTVFGGTQDTATGVSGFTQSADDARAVLLYLHDNAPR